MSKTVAILGVLATALIAYLGISANHTIRWFGFTISGVWFYVMLAVFLAVDVLNLKNAFTPAGKRRKTKPEEPEAPKEPGKAPGQNGNP